MQLITLNKAKQITGLSLPTLWRYRKAKILTTHIKGKRSVLVDVQELKNLNLIPTGAEGADLCLPENIQNPSPADGREVA